MQTSDALRLAMSRELDLVEISPRENPPVCRIMDFGKYRYEESRKEKKAKKRQHTTVVKEVKFHVNVEDHDYHVKMNHIRAFLSKGHRVKASLMFRGRENQHRDLGFQLINRLSKDCEDLGNTDAPARLFGNRLIVLINPQRPNKKSQKPEQDNNSSESE